jgi:hypothetical protein
MTKLRGSLVGLHMKRTACMQTAYKRDGLGEMLLVETL